MINILLFIGLISCTSAAISTETICPVVKPVENFNISGLVGVWYEIARYANRFEEQGDCVIEKYEKKDDSITFYITEVYNKKLLEFKGYVSYNNASSDKSYVLKYHSPSYKECDPYSIVDENKLKNNDATENGDVLPVSIVAVDYNNYLIAYECKHDKDNKRQDYAWLISRAKKLEGAAKTDVLNFMNASAFLDVDKFIWKHFNEDFCKVNS